MSGDKPKLLFVVPGDPLSWNPVTAFLQGLWACDTYRPAREAEQSRPQRARCDGHGACRMQVSELTMSVSSARVWLERRLAVPRRVRVGAEPRSLPVQEHAGAVDPDRDDRGHEARREQRPAPRRIVIDRISSCGSTRPTESRVSITNGLQKGMYEASRMNPVIPPVSARIAWR